MVSELERLDDLEIAYARVTVAIHLLKRLGDDVQRLAIDLQVSMDRLRSTKACNPQLELIADA